MKKLLLLSAAGLVASLVSVHAEEAALITIQIGKDPTPRLVALELHEAEAPRTVENFKKLAKKGFYKGVSFHRAFPHILVQTGDPLSRAKDRAKVGTGGPGYTLPPEIRRKHSKGAVAAARLPDKINPSRVSSGSQFFICLQPAPNYDGQYTVFGHVLYGYDALDEISTKPVDSNDYPLERSFIRSIKILPREQLPPEPGPTTPGRKPAKPWWRIFG
ncbi:MAG: peptidyl-prolyl cis-trans isomerase [Chthoniobacter sp.]|jgi:cyclophilin family peptidyl-prolyl cis-trans isomerase|nr:peptidyl-prolyl cis-trans isomerase [Chthoniobacter sp.]